MGIQLIQDNFKFLKALKENNEREWMTENKTWYLKNEELLKSFYKDVESGLNTFDQIEKTKVFRIHRDVRFSKNKTPYNVHRSASFSREGAHRRGGYYLRIEPNGKSRMSGGFLIPIQLICCAYVKNLNSMPNPFVLFLMERILKLLLKGLQQTIK